MAQQTQVARAAEFYHRWMKKFPTIRSLAAATKRDVLIEWNGLGYNRRALYLRETARIIVDKHRGKLPASFSELRALPGVGDYTANAILCFAYHERRVILDVNIRRVISRLFWKMKRHDHVLKETLLEKKAEEILPRRNFYDWNQALMDFGNLVCTKANPKCNACTLAPLCASSSTLSHQTIVRRKKNHQPIPRRIFRGKIISMLRASVRKNRLTIRDMETHLIGKYSVRNDTYLFDILKSLEQDGMIDAFLGKRKIALKNFIGDAFILRFSLST